MRLNPRSLHRRLSPALYVLLALTAATGLGYRVGKQWFGLDGQTGNVLMDIHAGGWLGTASSFYVILLGGGLLFLLGSGLLLLRQGRSRQPVRLSHRILGAILLLPLAISATTGLAYKLGQDWFGLSEETADLLMHLHEGAWLGREGRVYYVLLVGGGLLVLGLLGLRLLLPRRTAI